MAGPTGPEAPAVEPAAPSKSGGGVVGGYLAKTWKYVTVGVCFSAASVAMIVLNKLAIKVFPYPSVLMLLQIFTTILLVLGQQYSKGGAAIPAPSLADLLFWLPCSTLFFTNILSSIIALQYVTVSTFVVGRNLSPLVTWPLEAVVFKKPVSFEQLYNLSSIFLGTLLYGYRDLSFSPKGYLFCLLHIASNTRAKATQTGESPPGCPAAFRPWW